MSPFIKPGTPVVSRDGKDIGHATGSTHMCSQHGCNGVRVSVRWPDGAITFPCSKGMSEGKKGTWKLL